MVVTTTTTTPLGASDGDQVVGRNIKADRLIKNLLRIFPARHGEDPELLQGCGNVRVVTEIRGRAVQEDGCDVVLLVRLLEDTRGVDIPRVVQGIAAYIGNVLNAEILDVVYACVVQVPR